MKLDVKALFFTLTFSLISCDSSKNAKEFRPAEDRSGEAALETVGLLKGDVTRVISASGKIIPQEQVMVGSEVSGRVTEVFVDYNSAVKKGDVLAKIDAEKFNNTLEQLQGRLKSAQADILVQEASINRARVSLEQNRKVFDRQSNLFQQEAVSKARLEEAERSVGVSEADLKLAEARLVSSKAAIDQTKAQIRNAQTDLRRTVIRSPIDGVIIERKIDPGQTVQANFSAPELFIIAADLANMRVEAQIVESDVAGLNQGDTVKFTVDAYPDIIFEGAVEQLRYMSTTQNNIVTYVAIVTVRNEDGILLPGMTANLDITADVRPGVARLPISAERFRPTPEQIAKWQDPDSQQADVGALDAVYDRLKRSGVSDSKIDQAKGVLSQSAQPLIDIINDPEKSFMHTPMKIQLSDLTTNILRSQLSPAEFSDYNALLSSEKNFRLGELWVMSGPNKMKKVPVKFGLSDSAFVELVSGLSENDKVVTGISGRKRRDGRPGGRPGGAKP
jgi:HlyD family secretion protein